MQKEGECGSRHVASNIYLQKSRFLSDRLKILWRLLEFTWKRLGEFFQLLPHFWWHYYFLIMDHVKNGLIKFYLMKFLYFMLFSTVLFTAYCLTTAYRQRHHCDVKVTLLPQKCRIYLNFPTKFYLIPNFLVKYTMFSTQI